jgi:hypothetical protein
MVERGQNASRDLSATEELAAEQGPDSFLFYVDTVCRDLAKEIGLRYNFSNYLGHCKY